MAIARERLAHAGLSPQVARVEQAHVLTWSPPAPVGSLVQFEQVPRTEAADGWVAGPPYHCDINAMRALFTSERWVWTQPPYSRGREGDHLTVVLTARSG